MHAETEQISPDIIEHSVCTKCRVIQNRVMGDADLHTVLTGSAKCGGAPSNRSHMFLKVACGMSSKRFTKWLFKKFRKFWWFSLWGKIHGPNK
jgi:hypothetical protein